MRAGGHAVHLRQLAALDPAAGGAAVHRGAAGGGAALRLGAAEAGGERPRGPGRGKKHLSLYQISIVKLSVNKKSHIFLLRYQHFKKNKHFSRYPSNASSS